MVAIPIGPPTVLTQNQVYAVPAQSVTIQSTAALESSLAEAGPFTAFTTAIVTGCFIRCTTASPTVRLFDNTAG
jgi:hypothetical protein